MKSFTEEVKMELKLYYEYGVLMFKETVKTAVITWIPILIGLLIYNLLK